jgi:secondary thiamine-phosphate synthase enzyme
VHDVHFPAEMRDPRKTEIALDDAVRPAELAIGPVSSDTGAVSPLSFDLKTTTREVLVDVTALVRQAVKQGGLASGLVCVFCPHTTAGVTVQENADPDVRSDFIGHLARAVPKDGPFRHFEGNADAHIKASLVGASATLIVEGGRLVLGRWQAIYFCEFDGPRDRQLIVKLLAGT